MKKFYSIVLVACALLSVATSCVNEEPFETQTTTLTLSYSLGKTNEGESMARGAGNADIFQKFYDAIVDGRLMAPTYDLVFTEVATGEVYHLKGEWNKRESIEVKMGTYRVSGTATAEGAYIQEKCSISIDDSNVVIDRDDATITLRAVYDCALIIFEDESLASVVNYSGDGTQSFFKFENYLYAFVNETICNAEAESACLLGTRYNGSQFTIPTTVQPFDKGKYYVYDTTYTNSLEVEIVIPEMAEGVTGVVAQIGENVVVRNLKYDVFTMDVKVDGSVKEQNHAIKWAMGDLYCHNLNVKKNMSNAEMLNLHDTSWGGVNLITDSKTIVVDKESEVGFYDRIMPGQPQVLLFGEWAYGESDYGWGMGYYKPTFGEYGSGFYAQGTVVTKQPDDLGDHIESVAITPANENTSIRIDVDEAVKMLCIAVYDEATYATTMELLDGNADYRQWFATSKTAFTLGKAKRWMAYSQYIKDDAAGFDVTGSFPDGMELDFSLKELVAGEIDTSSQYVIDIVALAGDYDGDGVLDWNQQHYETYEFTLAPEAPPTNEIWYTARDGNAVWPNTNNENPSGFGATMVSNTYENGKGVMTFDGDVTMVGVRAFAGSEVATVTLPNSVRTIHDYAFSECNGLLLVDIPDGVVEIGTGAFFYCSILRSMYIPDSVTTVGENVFDGCISLAKFEGNRVSADGRCLVFDNTIVGFARAGLSSYTIPEGIVGIANSVFKNSGTLVSVILPSTLEYIGESAFAGSAFTSVTIPNSVKSVGQAAFYAHPAYQKLERFEGALASADGRCLIVNGELMAFAPAGLTSYSIPDGVTKINDRAFWDCTSLTSITIPDSVTAIGESAFSGSNSLVEFKGKFATADGCGVIVDGKYIAYAVAAPNTEYVIPDGVTHLGWCAFFGHNLTSITIPRSVIYIERQALDHRIGDHISVYCMPVEPPTMGNGYITYGLVTFYVPAESVNAYETAEGWSRSNYLIEPYEY